MFQIKRLLSMRGISQPGAAGGGGWLSSLREFGGGNHYSNPGAALAVAALQNCVTLLAESVAQLPVELYERKKSDDRAPARDHPLYPILKFQPNTWQTPYEYAELKQMMLGLRGNTYSFIDRDAAGNVLGLYPLDTEAVVVRKTPTLEPVYDVMGQPIPARNIHHVRWHSLNGYVGLSPIMLHANQVGHAAMIQEYASKSFVNGTALSGVIERPAGPAFKDQGTADRILDQWNAKFGGAGNAKKVALLQEGMTFKALSMSNVDSDLISMLSLTNLDIARIYKIPPHMIAELEHATFSNIEHQAIQFVIYTLMPWIKRHEQAMSRDLLLPSDRDRYYIEYNLAGLLRGDLPSRYAAYAVGRQWGWLSVNDIRRLEGHPPVAGGDVYLQPMNMVDATKVPDPTAKPATTVPGGAPIKPPAGTAPTQAQIDDIERILK